MEPVPMCHQDNDLIIKYSYVLTDQYRNTTTTGDVTDTTITFNELIPYVLYSFRVAAWTSGGEGSYSADIFERTLDDSKLITFNLDSPYP